MKYDFDTIAIRALNSCRLVHPPSYIGLRIFLDSLPKRNPSKLGEGLINRLLRFNTSWRYNNFKVFKKFNDAGEPQYRDFLFGSPTTVLCEAVILDFLSKQEVFRVHPCAYSYKWPGHTRQGRNHSFFLKGYKARNKKISQLLQEHPEKVALVTDIEKYYPSVSKETLSQKFHKRLSTLNDTAWRDIASTFCKCLLESGSQGIPVGPDFGHFLGHIALEDVDKTMSNMLGESYTRYVDDIVVVCNREDIPKVTSTLADALDTLGLKINHEKTDIVDSGNWLKSVPQIQQDRSETSFEKLFHDIVKYLEKYPDKSDILTQKFKESGFSIPFKRVLALSKYGRLTRFLHWLNPIYAMSQKGLLEKASGIKEAYLNALKRIRQQDIPLELTQKRWYIQKCSYYINRLLYLMHINEYDKLLSLIPEEDEFRQIREVMLSILNRNVSTLIQMPGPSIAAFCELWSENHVIPPVLDLNNHLPDEALDSYSILLLYRTVLLKSEILKIQSPKTQAFLNFCNGDSPETREFTNLSYIDELRSLQLNYTKEEMYDMLTTRYNNYEGLSPAALHLGISSFSL
jgi:hypothetical protein